ncbi:MAG TPA: sulfotransferase [Candidatus Paceibacterota bacterium]|nr:sulfotransferase [Candidatus Paceibacterota bacterium]
MKKSNERNQDSDTWPNFFIVGAPKAGTTSFYYYLKEIPEIYMSPIKEPNFFSKNIMPDKKPFKPIRNKEKYLELFKNVTNEIILGEATTNYLSDHDASILIKQVSPNAHILICLRDPVERAFSHYLMIKNDPWIESSFHKQLEKEMNGTADFSKPSIQLPASFYSIDVQRFIDTFGAKNVKIIIFEEFVKQPKQTVYEILKFLGIKYKLNNFKPEKYNAYSEIKSPGKILKQIQKSNIVKIIGSKILSSSQKEFIKNIIFKRKKRKPKMSNEDREILKIFYNDDVQKLKTILNRDLPWKNFSNINN